MDFVHNPYRCGPLRVGRYGVDRYLIRQSQFAIPGWDGPVIFEQRHGSCLLIRVKTLTPARSTVTV